MIMAVVLLYTTKLCPGIYAKFADKRNHNV